MHLKNGSFAYPIGYSGHSTLGFSPQRLDLLPREQPFFGFDRCRFDIFVNDACLYAFVRSRSSRHYQVEFHVRRLEFHDKCQLSWACPALPRELGIPTHPSSPECLATALQLQRLTDPPLHLIYIPVEDQRRRVSFFFSPAC